MAQWVKQHSQTPNPKQNAGSGLSRSASCSASLEGGRVDGSPSAWARYPRGNPADVPGSCLWPGLVLVVAAIWGEGQADRRPEWFSLTLSSTVLHFR